jgi:hypothetical protein
MEWPLGEEERRGEEKGGEGREGENARQQMSETYPWVQCALIYITRPAHMTRNGLHVVLCLTGGSLLTGSPRRNRKTALLLSSHWRRPVIGSW